MFSAATRPYFERLPDLPGLEPDDARRVLTAAYADVLSARDGFSREGGPPISEVVAYLRRLAATLEVHAVFSEDAGPEERRAAAFIAAESLSLTHRIALPVDDEPGAGGDEVALEDETEPPYRLADRVAFEGIEAALLYVIGGFETNGALIVAGLGAFEPPTTEEGAAAEQALEGLVAFVRLARGAPIEILAEGGQGLNDDQGLTSQARALGFARIADAASEHLRWLRGGDEGAWLGAIGALRESIAILASAGAGRYADIQHLSRLLLLGIEETGTRALRTIPRPTGDGYANYINVRALERPLVWPSGLDYVTECLPGPHRHAAVALPTGSGKSFIAELAVSQAVRDGWALYLVPTNALATQVRRDLASGLASLEGVTVRAFVGGSEYTELAGEVVADVEVGTVMVMTPEKCALALRRTPDAFATLRLCVFDECHLISESGGRGVLAELVAAHVMTMAPEVRFLLLSAMLENPQSAAEWLEAVTGVGALAVRTPWRPTRTLRGVLGFESGSYREASETAQAALAELGNNRVNLNFAAPFAALVNLQGAWTDLDEAEYALLRLDVEGTLTMHRSRSGDAWRYQVKDDGYLNPTVAVVASMLSQRGEKVLAFVPRNRHHAFSVAMQVVTGDTAELADTVDGRLVDAYLQVASVELGVRTVLLELIQGGITVHSSALTDSERSASELAFQRGLASVMVATGTLAQGLNLPATVVLIGGTEIGFSPTPDAEAEARVRAQLLNAIGRSGRPGVANHGVAIVVPNHALGFEATRLNVRSALERAGVLAYEDASVVLSSQLASLITLALEGDVVPDAMSTDEMVAYTYLPEVDVQDGLAQTILRHTYGLWAARPDSVPETADAVAHELQEVGAHFLEAAAAPAWTTEVAYRSGLPLPDVFALYRAADARLAEERPTDIEDWLLLLIDLLRTMAPERLQALLFAGISLKGLSFVALGEEPAPPESAWEAFSATMLRYMRGESLASIAAYATGVEPPIDDARTVGSKPIPKILTFLNEMGYRLSLCAGALTALWVVGDELAPVAEIESWALPPESRDALNLLPVAIRCGAGTRSSLAWYRFGIRHRVSAHMLARTFPLPAELHEDFAVRAWIRDTRQAWLNGDGPGLEDLPEPGTETALRRVARFENI